MPAIVEFPTIVQKAVEQYKDFFRNEPERKHFGEYLTGLYIAEKKTVSGINSEFATTTDQSCLNRWLTQAPWDAQKLYEERLKAIQKDPQMQYSEEGVIPLDNTLIDHEGKFIEDVGYFWDHADKRYLIAHDYLIANYVCTSGKHYALEFRCFRKKEDCQLYREYLEKQPGGISAASPQEQQRATFRSHTDLCKELVDWVIAHQIPGNFAFDSYFTNAPVLNHVDGKKRNYVGDLKFNRKIWFQGKEMHASDLAALIDSESRKPVVMSDN
jgi:DDE superfamily endonuclease